MWETSTQEHALQYERLRLQNEALMDEVHLQQGDENLASDMVPLFISLDDDASVDTFKSFDLSPV